MKRFLLDTGIAGDYINDRNGIVGRVKAEVLRGNIIGIGIPVLAELQFGVANSADPRRSSQLLFRALPTLRVWPVTNEAAAAYGRLSAEMKKLGRAVQQMDRLIAAIALTLPDCAVVSSDSDMLLIPKLDVENWLVP